VANLGGPGDVVKVKPGYAHNFLIPMNLAMPMTEENLRRIESEKAELAAFESKLKADAEAIRDANKDLFIEFEMKSGNEGVLYGSVTPQDVADALHEKGLEVDRKKLIFPEAIKRLGVFDVALRLHPEVDLDMKIIVTDESGTMPDEIQEEVDKARKELSGTAEETVEVPEEVTDTFLTDEAAEEAGADTMEAGDPAMEDGEEAGLKPEGQGEDETEPVAEVSESTEATEEKESE
jgi:large subunit ribosomal protein L9